MSVVASFHSAKTPAELIAEGWERCFIADEPRLSEAVETYRELGFDVALVSPPSDDEACTECMTQDPGRYSLIFIRKAR